MQIPFTYCWSPTVVPKPPDWGAHIDVTGYLFLNESKLRAEGYTPPQDLASFLAAGPPPVYIGAPLLSALASGVDGLEFQAGRQHACQTAP